MAGIFALKPRRELKEFYWFSALFSFATALVTIFEPVFFYQAGFSLAQIAIYFGLHYVTYLILLPLGGKFASRFGLERSLAFSLPLFMAYFLVLAAVGTTPGLFWMAWLVLAIFKIFYWPAYYGEYSRFGDKLNRGTEVSFGYVLNLGVGVLGPLAGGFVAAWYGFSALFILVAGVGLLAAIPLLRTREKYHVRAFAYASPWRIITSRQHRRMVVATFGWVEDFVNLVFWPVFAFIVLGAADVLGIVASVSILVMFLLAFFIGEWSDRVTPRQVLKRSGPALSLSYLLRLFATSMPRIFGVHALALSADAAVKIPFMGKIYDESRRHGVLEYTIAFEMVLCLAKAAAAFVLAGIFFWWGEQAGFTAAFLGASIFTWLYLKL